jgi:hypothetical protein
MDMLAGGPLWNCQVHEHVHTQLCYNLQQSYENGVQSTECSYRSTLIDPSVDAVVWYSGHTASTVRMYYPGHITIRDSRAFTLRAARNGLAYYPIGQ